MSVKKKLLQCSGSSSGSESFTTPGTYYWTAPAGVTKVDVTGQGGSLDSYYTWSDITGSFYVSYLYPASTVLGSVYGTSLTYETVESEVAAIATLANTVTTNANGATLSGGWNYQRRYARQSGGANWYIYTAGGQLWTNGSYVIRRVGTFDTSYNYGTGEIPANFVNTVKRKITGAQLQRRVTSYTYGTDSTAFGQTFPDNSSQATYTEIPVTPGTEYTIVVGTDGGVDTAFVNFDYY